MHADVDAQLLVYNDILYSELFEICVDYNRTTS